MSNMKRNAAVFEDTRSLCKNNSTLSMAISHSNTFQTIYTRAAPAPVSFSRFDQPAVIVVSKKRSFEAAAAYKDRSVCVLNFASSTNPGGGVKWGAAGQEESLCRCSTLYENLNTKDSWNSFYGPHRKANNPLGNNDVIYTPKVVVFKTDAEVPVLMEQEQWFTCSVVTCSPPDLRPDRETGRKVHITHKKLKELLMERLHYAVSAAMSNENDVLILGAFGCGAFRNQPETVATAMVEVVGVFRYCFKTIEIAVCCDERNKHVFEVFDYVFSGYVEMEKGILEDQIEDFDEGTFMKFQRSEDGELTEIHRR